MVGAMKMATKDSALIALQMFRSPRLLVLSGVAWQQIGLAQL